MAVVAAMAMALSAGQAAFAAAAAAVEPERPVRGPAEREAAKRSDASDLPGSARPLRLESDDGIFAVFEAPYDPEFELDESGEKPIKEPRRPIGYLAYWNNQKADRIFVYGRMLQSAGDVAEALRALEMAFGADPARLAGDNQYATEALRRPRQAPPAGTPGWLVSTREQVMVITGQWSLAELELYNASAVTAGSDDDEDRYCPIPVRPGEDQTSDPYLGALQSVCRCVGDEDPGLCTDDDLCTNCRWRNNGDCSVRCSCSRKICPCGNCLTNCRCDSVDGRCKADNRTCSDHNECTRDYCYPYGYAGCPSGCRFANKPAGTPCNDDGDPCTQDVCQGPPCIAGCTQCQTSVCVPLDACPDRLCCEGTCCDECYVCCGADGDECCRGECHNGSCCTGIMCSGVCCGSLYTCDSTPSCVDGQCVEEGPVCDDGDPCTLDQCTPDPCGKQVCDNSAPAPPNTPCALDGNPCTEDVCQDGQCVNDPEPRDGDYCPDTDENQCTAGACSGGECVPQPILDGIHCTGEDDNPCTYGLCTGGQCLPQPNPAANGTACTGEDNDPCTVGECSSGSCVPVPGNNGAPCQDDGDPCTDDICSNGACTHQAGNCDDSDPCTVDSCHPMTGQCLHEPLCDDDDPCTEDSCDPATVQCAYDAVCDDEDLCTVDCCDPDTQECTYAPLCDDGNACTEDLCDDGVCSYVTQADGTPCADDCIGGTCDGGACVGESPCPDGTECCGDFCCSGGFVGNRPAALVGCTACCEAGPCEGVNCDDSNPCTIDKCNPVTGDCIHKPRVELSIAGLSDNLEAQWPGRIMCVDATGVTAPELQLSVSLASSKQLPSGCGSGSAILSMNVGGIVGVFSDPGLTAQVPMTDLAKTWTPPSAMPAKLWLKALSPGEVVLTLTWSACVSCSDSVLVTVRPLWTSEAFPQMTFTVTGADPVVDAEAPPPIVTTTSVGFGKIPPPTPPLSITWNPAVSLESSGNHVACNQFVVGVIQNLRTYGVTFQYSDVTVAHDVEVPSLDAAEPSSVPFYHSSSRASISACGVTQNLAFDDTPYEVEPWTNPCPNRAGSLESISYTKSFETWLVARHTASGCYRVLKHFTWSQDAQGTVIAAQQQMDSTHATSRSAIDDSAGTEPKLGPPLSNTWQRVCP